MATSAVVAQILPWRFLMMLLHLVMTICVYQTHVRFDSIQVAIQPSTPAQEDHAYSDAADILETALGISVFCFTLEFVGLFVGLSMFHLGLNVAYVVAHFFGCFFLFYFMLDSWSYKTYPYIFFFFSLLPAVAEVLIMLHWALFKMSLWKYIEIRV